MRTDHKRFIRRPPSAAAEYPQFTSKLILDSEEREECHEKMPRCVMIIAVAGLFCAPGFALAELPQALCHTCHFKKPLVV